MKQATWKQAAYATMMALDMLAIFCEDQIENEPNDVFQEWKKAQRPRMVA